MADKKSEVRQIRRCGRVSKRNVKAPVLSLLNSESDINLSSVPLCADLLSKLETHRDLPSEK